MTWQRATGYLRLALSVVLGAWPLLVCSRNLHRNLCSWWKAAGGSGHLARCLGALDPWPGPSGLACGPPFPSLEGMSQLAGPAPLSTLGSSLPPAGPGLHSRPGLLPPRASTPPATPALAPTLRQSCPLCLLLHTLLSPGYLIRAEGKEGSLGHRIHFPLSRAGRSSRGPFPASQRAVSQTLFPQDCSPPARPPARAPAATPGRSPCLTPQTRAKGACWPRSTLRQEVADASMILIN